MRRRDKFAFVFIILSGFVMFFSPIIQKTEAARTYSGRVFHDFNGNGVYDTSGGTTANPAAVDFGIANVTVSVYDAAGILAGSTTTGSSGTYSLTVANGIYRLEFTNLPAGYFPSARSTDSVNGGSATNSGSTVQFVPNSHTNDVNLAVNRPTDYCQDNPLICATNYTFGAQTDAAIFVIPYNAGSTRTSGGNPIDDFLASTPARVNLATTAQVGTTYGMAYSRSQRKIFAGAFMKKHAAFGPGGTGAIYQIDRASGDAVSVYANLNTIFGANTAGANPHNVNDYDLDNGNTTWDAVGKAALGGMAISDDETKLYVMNLANRTLYEIPLNQTPASANIRTRAFPLTGVPNCPNSSDVRPFAVSFYENQIYVGAVCSADVSDNAADLRAYVYQVEPTTLTFSAAPVFQAPLNYPRLEVDPGYTALWNAWRTNYSTISTGHFIYPQPMLTDIDFDRGNLILSLRDRNGDQSGYYTLSNPTNTSQRWKGITGGDVLRACGSPSSGWTLESNGRCGGSGGAPQNTGEGPGGGEYYYQDNYHPNGNPHDEVGNGGALQLPGYNNMAATVMDPVYLPNDNIYDAGGFRWFNNATGAQFRGYLSYAAGTSSFGKANGIGGTVPALCDAAPIEIGNRVWRDTNNNGVQDAGESGIANVTVRLYQGSTQIASAVTDASGEFYFSSAAGTNTANTIYGLSIQPNTSYQLRLDNTANFSSGGVLNNLLLTITDQTSQAGFAEGSDSDAVLAVNPTGSAAGIFPVISFTTGASGDNNHNLDFGFASSTVYSLGNRVWYDTNNDGQINAGEVGVPAGVSVSVFVDANADGQPDNPSSPAQTTATDANGYYRFDNLAAGNYVVRINPSNFTGSPGYRNSAITNHSDLDSTSITGQNGENGVNPVTANSILTSGILSGTIFLGAPGAPTGEIDVSASGQGAIDPAANMTVDFGFYRACLSGTVWNDNGNGVAANNNNGILNTGESGISSVRVQLFNSSNAEIPVGADGILGTADDGANGVLTNNGGNYSFCGLPSGQYRVVLTPTGGTSSTPTSNNPDDNVDSDDNGFAGTGAFTGKIVSGLVTVTPGSTGALNNNTVSNNTGLTSNPTVDFGFVFAPTAIKLDKFEAETDGTAVWLKWTTGGESDNLGFNVYRQAGGKRELLNVSPIAGSSLRSNANLQVSGDTYAWMDFNPSFNALYYLEDIDLNGNRTMHGPVSPMFKISTGKQQKPARLISDLTETESPSAQKEFVGERHAETSITADRKAILSQQQIAASNGVKISVRRDGWYRISAAQLQSAGFDINSNRDFWQLFARAEEVPIKINSDGAIEFFGRGLDTVSTERQIYYLVSAQNTGRRIAEIKGGGEKETPSDMSFPVTAERKDRTSYSSAILNGEAENWFGSVINRTSQTVQQLNVFNPDETKPAWLSLRIQGLTAGEHIISVRFNDVDLGTVNLLNQENKSFEFELHPTAVNNGINQITYQALGSGNDISLTDTAALSYSRRYQAVNNRLHFTVAPGEAVRVGGFSEAKINVFEIRGGQVERQAMIESREVGRSYEFGLSAADYEREFIALTAAQFDSPVSVEQNLPSNWNSADNEADFVIIAPNNLRGFAERLADLRRENQGLKTEIVSVEDLFDEFTFGAHSPEAIKQFLQNASENWRVKPRYALLFGDSSFDPRGYLGLENRDLVPTKLFDADTMETSSDAWLADFDGDGIEDIALGRLPVVGEQQASAMLNKLIRYEQQNLQAEKSTLLVSDRGFENYSTALQSELPSDVRVSRIDRSALTDAEMQAAIISQANASPTVVTYSGHGSTGVWGGAGVFTSSHGINLNNNRLSFYLMMTCLNGFTNGATADSLSEAVMRANGGAIAVWASSGTTSPNGQFQISRTVNQLVFDPSGNQLRIGDIVRRAKQTTTDQFVRKTWQLVGDPTLVIK